MQSLAPALALLANTPAALDALLRTLPTPWIDATEGPATWSPAQVIGHLVDCERTNWLPRTKWLIQHGETRPFTPFDRGGLERETIGKTLPQLLDEFARLRSANLAELLAMNLTESDLARTGIHPAFGQITLGQMLSTWATHDLDHLHQIARTLARQTTEAVGPWKAYLGVLHCNAHGA